MLLEKELSQVKGSKKLKTDCIETSGSENTFETLEDKNIYNSDNK
jgi:hypothetical protein